MQNGAQFVSYMIVATSVPVRGTQIFSGKGNESTKFVKGLLRRRKHLQNETAPRSSIESFFGTVRESPAVPGRLNCCGPKTQLSKRRLRRQALQLAPLCTESQHFGAWERP